MTLSKTVGVVALRKKEDLDIHLVGQKHVDASERSLDTRRIGIVDQSDIVCETAYKPDLAFGKRSAGRSHHILNSSLVHRYDIEIALDHYAFVAPGNGVLGLIEAVELIRFLIDLRLRRVYIFSYILVRAHRAPTECKHTSRNAVDRKHHAAAEAIVKGLLPIPLGNTRQTRPDHILGIEARVDGRAEQIVAFVDRISEVKPLYHGVADAAAPEISKSYVPSGIGLKKIVLEVSEGEIVDSKHGLTVVLRAPFFGTLLFLDNLYIIFSGQIAERLGIGKLLDFHDEIHGRATFAATETLAYISGFIDRKRGCALAVKRAQSLIVGTGTPQLHEVAYNFDYIGGVKNSVYCLLINTGHRSESFMLDYDYADLRHTCRFCALSPEFG